MKAKCYACDERIDHHNRCRKRACRAQLEKRKLHSRLTTNNLKVCFTNDTLVFTHIDY